MQYGARNPIRIIVMFRVSTVALFAILFGSIVAHAQGGFANRTQCYINGRWVTVVGNCPSTSSSGSSSGSTLRREFRLL